MRIILPILLLACADTADPVPVAIYPADGQTHVGLEQPLLFEGYVGNLPPGEPLPGFVRVIDLGAEREVFGSLIRVERGARFTPDAPWPIDSEFLWTLEPPLVESRQPEMQFPEDADGQVILGSGRFSTAADIRPLDLHTQDSDLCLITSQPPLPSDLPTFEVAFGDRRGAPQSVSVQPSSDYEANALPQGDQGLGVICAQPPFDGLPDRAWIRDQSVASTGEVGTGTVIAALRRPR